MSQLCRLGRGCICVYRVPSLWAIFFSLIFLSPPLGLFSDALCSTSAQEKAAFEVQHTLQSVRELIQAGEYSSARQAINTLAAEEKATAQGELSESLARAGYSDRATALAMQIPPGKIRQQTMRQLFRTGTNSDYPGSSNSLDRITNFPGDGGNAGGQGGGAIADFEPLMELIRTTIVPDTWEDLGGPSTMAEYRGGVLVDPQGMVRDIQPAVGDALASISNTVLLARQRKVEAHARHWTRPSKLRFISLKGLNEQFVRSLMQSGNVSAEVYHLAGISEIQYVIIQPDDVVFAGPVGGIDPGAAPWPRDLQTGQVPITLDILMQVAKTVSEQGSFSCSIDPTTDGLAAAQTVSRQINQRQIPSALAADALATALGNQKISLTGLANDDAIGWLLVEADRHMKQLALGQHPLPEGMLNYLQHIEKSVQNDPKQGVPGGQLLRLWLAAQPKSVRKAPDSHIYELQGFPVRLLSGKEIADQQGQRRDVGVDPIAEQFAEHFSRNLPSITNRYPIYDRIRGIYEVAAALQLVRQSSDAENYQRLMGELTQPDLFPFVRLSTPRECKSIAVRHTVKTSGKRHEVYVASGGIEVTPSNLLVSKMEVYPALVELTDGNEDKPIANTHWWWDR